MKWSWPCAVAGQNSSEVIIMLTHLGSTQNVFSRQTAKRSTSCDGISDSVRSGPNGSALAKRWPEWSSSSFSWCSCNATHSASQKKDLCQIWLLFFGMIRNAYAIWMQSHSSIWMKIHYAFLLVFPRYEKYRTNRIVRSSNQNSSNLLVSSILRTISYRPFPEHNSRSLVNDIYIDRWQRYLANLGRNLI